MRNTVSKQLRRICNRLQRNRAYYRALKKQWHHIPPVKRAAVLRAWKETLDEGGIR